MFRGEVGAYVLNVVTVLGLLFLPLICQYETIQPDDGRYKMKRWFTGSQTQQCRFRTSNNMAMNFDLVHYKVIYWGSPSGAEHCETAVA